jgi:hypothetical protein
MLPTPLPHLPLKLLLPQPLPPLLLPPKASNQGSFPYDASRSAGGVFFSFVMPGPDWASPLTNLSLDVYIPRSQIHFVRLLSRKAHISVKKQAVGLGIKRIL